MLFGKPWEEWIAQYELSHQNPINRLTHTLGIPMIAASIPLFVLALVWPGFWVWPTALFVVGWVLQIVGHMFEGKRPEFFNDWRFLFVGLRWWVAKTLGKPISKPPARI